MPSIARSRLTLAVVSALIASASMPSLAQEAAPAPAPAQAPAAAPAAPAAAKSPVELDTLVVTGTRVQGRSPTETLSPVDVFRPADLEKQASADFTDQLSVIAPSFNTQRFPIADGTAFVRPANLRNLPPDQTLVLINGKRRHRSALVNLQVEPFGTVNQGSQAVDYSLIPSAAIQRVEVLRDGSSAQYGSDAIAGVINVMLNDYSEGVRIDGQYGSTYEGDGDKWRTSINFGAPLSEDGFFNMTFEYFDSDHTSRGIPRADAAQVGAFVGNDLVPFEGLGQRWGDPDGKGLRSFLNGEYKINDSVSLYGFGSYAETEYESSFFYRTPVGVPGVTPRNTLFVDSVNNATGAAGADGLPDPVAQSLINDIRARGLNPADYVTASATSPSGFVALNPIFSRFPGGYTPTFGADVDDYEGVFGARGELGSGLTWDVSLRQGENNMIYTMVNSINPSLGVTSPTSFKPGDLTQFERGANADFVYPWQNDFFASPINVAFGAEWREETYKIKPGDPASFENGPTGVLFGFGSDGFQGDSPEASGEFSQYSRAAYIDLESDVVERLSMGLAGRYEDSSGFDSTLDWKLSSRFEATDALAFRATVNTGFRTPTPGQLNTLDVTTTADSTGALVPLGTFPVNHPAAIALGSQPLDAEESFAYSAGLVYAPNEKFSFTIDYYNIEVEDRIALQTINIVPGSPEQQALIDAGVPGAALLGQVSYFVNGFDSTVQGVDLVAVYRADFADWGTGVFDFRHSYNKQEIDSVAIVPGTTRPVIDAERVADLENQLPNNRSVITFDWRTPWNFTVTSRANYYDSWEDFTFGEKGEFGSEWLFDLAVTVDLFDGKGHFTVGGSNIFDNYPDKETNGTLNFLGAQYPLSSPFGFNGGEWYVKMSYEF
ncbi:TonB-dependent receptor plug domain-containing protein [Lysobacter niastensis]|uniref:TonB-dependent receptor plug domain-containing protein n=1 Tax=Lysobacter niastensis TaxID=380629 RepID=A0ABS0BBY9_9GAMM|nr:TonB-dependent receptor [Lysobacter niastensis]MBF6025266.1 TonB-dependent receptor plug domain-containing protein [Lysobacter niastensis]